MDPATLALIETIAPVTAKALRGLLSRDKKANSEAGTMLLLAMINENMANVKSEIDTLKEIIRLNGSKLDILIGR